MAVHYKFQRVDA